MQHQTLEPSQLVVEPGTRPGIAIRQIQASDDHSADRRVNISAVHIVRWYNPDKGFGFVELANGSGDAFLHVSVVERAGHGSVPPGATLEVRAGPGPKGQQVTEIVSLDAGTASQEQPRRPRPERPDFPRGDRATVEELGTVKWYNAMKGFGFIAADRGGKDIFVHASALERGGVMGLAEGQRFAVDVADGQKGPEVINLRLA